MAHFAQIEGGRVVNVIVAEADFVATLDGTWVQTSYNTRGGVHYNSDGSPSGQPGLRKNYAGIGYIYDVVLDAFYEERDPLLWDLDPVTCTWTPKPPPPEPT
jgi:hypothetical protein